MSNQRQPEFSWFPDTRPKKDNPDPNAATILDIELATKFRQLVDLVCTDPHLPGRLREAVAELTAVERAEVVELTAELAAVKAEWYEPVRYAEDVKAAEVRGYERGILAGLEQARHGGGC